MARPLRLDYCGAVWHLTARGNDRQDIVRDDHDRQAFVDLLGRCVQKYSWILHSWTLTGAGAALPDTVSQRLNVPAAW